MGTTSRRIRVGSIWRNRVSRESARTDRVARTRAPNYSRAPANPHGAATSFPGGAAGRRAMGGLRDGGRAVQPRGGRHRRRRTPVTDHAAPKQAAPARGRLRTSALRLEDPEARRALRQSDHDLLRLSQPHAPLRNGEAAEFERRCDIKHTAEPLFEGAEQSFLGGYTEHLVMAMVREAVAGANSHDVADSPPPLHVSGRLRRQTTASPRESGRALADRHGTEAVLKSRRR